MARTPRGRTGSAGGVPPTLVTDILYQLVAKIEEQHGAVFKREQAAEILRELVGEDQVERFLEQLVQVPGISAEGDGMYSLPTDARFLVKHRQWRFAVGRLDLQEASQLLVLLDLSDPENEGGEDRLCSGLRVLKKRLQTAVGSLQ